jgi:arsenate reductase
MKTIYYLSSCSTCIRIMKEIGVDNNWQLIDIKQQNIDEKTLEGIKAQKGTYESVFSKKAIKYKSMGLKDKNLKEEDFKQLILSEYTFLQRPVIKINEIYFVGNSKTKIAEVITELSK